jgi:hypothetical protein
MVLKPADQGPSLADSIGNLTVSNRVFVFDSDSFPVEAIARMSPESALHMQTCHDVQNDNSVKSTAQTYDTDNNFKITKDEFIAAHSAPNGAAAFEFVKSLQPVWSLARRTHPQLSSASSCMPTGGGGNLLHPGVESRTHGGTFLKTPLVPEVHLGLSASFHFKTKMPSSLLFLRPSLIPKYPSVAAMEDKLLNCEELPQAEATMLASCSAKSHLGESGGKSYYPIGPGDGGASSATSNNSIFGISLTYPSMWQADFYTSKNLKAASCLISTGELHLSELLQSMGCGALAAEHAAASARASQGDEASTDNHGDSGMSTGSIGIVLVSVGSIVGIVVGTLHQAIKQERLPDHSGQGHHPGD